MEDDPEGMVKADPNMDLLGFVQRKSLVALFPQLIKIILIN